MAQIWLTYQELADVVGSTPEEARRGAIEHGWARMKGRDGVAHVRLPAALTHLYLQSIAQRQVSQGTGLHPMGAVATIHPMNLLDRSAA